MRNGQDSIADVPDRPPQCLLSKEGMTEFFSRLLDYTRTHSQNDENVDGFEQDMNAWRDYIRRAYDSVSKDQADQMALEVLKYIKLSWYVLAVQCRKSAGNGVRLETAFLDKLLDSMGFESKT